LIVSDGKPRTLGPLSLKRVYSGPEGNIDLFVHEGALWVAGEFDKDLTKTGNVVATADLTFALFETLREHGVKHLYCCAGNQSSFNFNRMLGFETTHRILVDKYEVMVKDL